MRKYGIPAVEFSSSMNVINKCAFLTNGGVTVDTMVIQIFHIDGDDRKELRRELGEFLYAEIRQYEFDSLSESKRKEIGLDVDEVTYYEPDRKIFQEINVMDEESILTEVNIRFDDVEIEWREELSRKIIDFVADYYSDLKDREITMREEALDRIKELVMEEIQQSKPNRSKKRNDQSTT